VYDGLLIIWDEFTEIMTSSIGVRLLVRLQEVAEAMMNVENDSYFLFISHPSALNTINEAEREKTKGRYHYVAYNMEPVSAFKIMSKKFKIVDDVVYNQRKSRFFALHGDLLNAFSSSSTNALETIENIQNLYPIHPSTANLATYYAREAEGYALLDALGCEYRKNQAGLFVWAKIPASFEGDCFAFSDKVLDECDVFITPGGIFGSEGERYIRISLCMPKERLAEAAERVKSRFTK
jgi:hypothetical protein